MYRLFQVTNSSKQDHKYFKRFYIFGVLSILLVLLANQWIIQSLLDARRGDVHTINIAGRQRVVSKNIAALACYEESNSSLILLLKQNALHFDSIHQVLMSPKSDLTQTILEEPENYLMINQLDSIATALVNSVMRINNPVELRVVSQNIHLSSKNFFPIMDALVAKYEEYSANKINNLIALEALLGLLTLALITLEFQFIFRTIYKLLIHQKKKLQYENSRLKKIAWIQSHEVRGPVSSILGLVNLIKDKALPVETANIIGHLETSSKQLDEVIRKITSQTTEAVDQAHIQLSLACYVGLCWYPLPTRNNIN
jgi:nitrate/nitrite-specific signal transduction histidine kinase